jgi:hypothetical protein
MEIKIGKYRHFKGDLVEVIGKALHSENLEEFVVYKHINGKHIGHLWIRPIKMFLEEIEKNGKKVKRFEYIEE